MSTIRSFIALPLNDEIQKFIKHVQTILKKTNCKIKWVDPANTHITLKFLGNIAPEDIERVIKQLESIRYNLSIKKFGLQKVGAFPSANRPKIIWLGIADPQKELTDLSQTVDVSMDLIGFPKQERAFKPHITIGRVKQSKNLHGLAKQLDNIPMSDVLYFRFEKIVFYKSTLTPQGPIYDALHEINFS